MKINWENWQEEICEKFGIEYVPNREAFVNLLHNKDLKILMASRCSKTKTGKQQALPKEFYVSPLNLNFYKSMEANDFDYAILSDMYGIHYFDERMDFYDVHPSSLTAEDKISLGNKIKEKAEARGYNSIIFYNSSPIMSKPYFEMLKQSGLKVYYVSNISIFHKHKEKSLF